MHIAPSILAADFANLGDAVAQVADTADSLHVDVMDGHFVPNLTIGPPVVASLRKATDLPLDCHLMMTNPGEYFEAFKKAGADELHDPRRDRRHRGAASRRCATLGLGVGLAVNPDGNYDMVKPFIADIDLLLVMSVFPGFGGQSFIADALQTVKDAARRHRRARSVHRDPDRRRHRHDHDRRRRRRRRDQLRRRHGGVPPATDPAAAV